ERPESVGRLPPGLCAGNRPDRERRPGPRAAGGPGRNRCLPRRRAGMSEFWLFVQQTVNGLVLGSTYSLVAVGYTLVFGVLRILNMAHGEILMAGGFFGLLFATSVSLGLVPTLIVAALGAGLLGVLMERLAIRPLSKANHLAPLITTIGVSTLLQSLATRIFGP